MFVLDFLWAFGLGVVLQAHRSDNYRNPYL